MFDNILIWLYISIVISCIVILYLGNAYYKSIRAAIEKRKEGDKELIIRVNKIGEEMANKEKIVPTKPKSTLKKEKKTRISSKK